jgi:hypothetical protein
MMFKTTLVAAASLLSLTAGLASASTSSARMSDAQYIQADRCQALATASTLGVTDVHAYDALIRQQERGRTEMAYDRATQAHDDAARQARVAGPYQKAQLAAERDGPCRAMLATNASLATSN